MFKRGYKFNNSLRFRVHQFFSDMDFFQKKFKNILVQNYSSCEELWSLYKNNFQENIFKPKIQDFV